MINIMVSRLNRSLIKKKTMKSNAKIILALAAGMFLTSSYFMFSQSREPINSLAQNEQMPLVQARYTENTAPPADFERAAEGSVSSVVHIRTVIKFNQTSSRKQQQQQNPFGDLFGNDDLFKRFFGNGGGFVQPDQKASGSGVIISNDGYIVTNNHVVEGASEITVTCNDRKNYSAKVVGTDPNTDLALLKIDAHNLPVLPVGNSDNVHLGQWVLAIGYPLNLDVTVTQGIVSAKSRNIGINRMGSAPVEAFIQTDAAVNPGSSGGALINTDGELIGINAAIASPTGSYAGYAYSIPSNLMKKVIGDLMKFGSVQRGYLGISMAPEDIDDAHKKELGITNDINGVWVMETDPSGAAAEAGIRKGDIITSIDGQVINTSAELSEKVARNKPGDKISIGFLRGKDQKTVTAILKNKMGTFASQQAALFDELGAKFESLDKADAAKVGISGGVSVTDINNEGLINDQTNMKPGFIITKVNGQAVRTIDELKQILSKQDSNLQLEGVYPGSSNVYYYGINDFRK